MLAKIAATVDVVSGGRLDFGIGAGSRPSHPLARREYEAHGLPYHDAAHAVGSLAEACTVIQRLWTETEPFDFDGTYVQLTGAFGNPKPVQRPHPPIMIGGRSTATLRVVAEHADLWNIPGGDIDDASVGALCWTASAPRSAATPPRSPAPSSCRSSTTARRHPGGDRRGRRRGLPPRHPRVGRALSRRCRTLGRRRDHHAGTRARHRSHTVTHSASHAAPTAQPASTSENQCTPR